MGAAQTHDDERLATAVLRLNGTILGLVFGLVAGLVIFVATIWLVIKGGEVVGPHLGLLREFFFGYSVTLGGSFVGMTYGFVTGYIAGWVTAWAYNGIVLFKEKNK